MDFVDLIWGKKDGPARLIVNAAKALFCLIAAGLIHQLLIILIIAGIGRSAGTMGSAPEDAPTYAALAEHVSRALASLDVRVELCVRAPLGTEPGFCKADPVGQDTSRDAGPSNDWLAFDVKDAEGQTSHVPFVSETKWPWLISNPAIIHSTDSLARIVERAARAETNEGTTTGLRLCAGTRKVLDEETCTSISQSLQPLTARLQSDLLGLRLIPLFFGFIQFLTLSVFIYIMIELLGLRLNLLSAPVLFFNREKRTAEPPQQNAADSTVPSPRAADQEDEPATIVKTGTSFSSALEHYKKAKRRSAIDRMYVRTLLSMNRESSFPNTGNGDNGPAIGAADSFREYQVSEHDEAITALDVANEVMLKLAFAGTIWGIGNALFLARSLDTLDPIEKIIVKAGMFAGIATAFGTTLVGVILSIVASVRVQSLARSWADLINQNYRFISEIGVAAIIQNSQSLTTSDRTTLRPKAPFEKAKRPMTIIEWTGLIGLLVLISIFAWKHRDVMISAASTIVSGRSSGD